MYRILGNRLNRDVISYIREFVRNSPKKQQQLVLQQIKVFKEEADNLINIEFLIPFRQQFDDDELQELYDYIIQNIEIKVFMYKSFGRNFNCDIDDYDSFYSD